MNDDNLETTVEMPPIENNSPETVANPTPNDPPWSITAAIGVGWFSILSIVFVPTIFVLPYLVLNKVPTAEFQTYLLTDKNTIIIQLLSTIPAHILTFVLAYFVITAGRKYSFFEMVGWQSGGMRWWHYVVLLIGFYMLAAVVNEYFPSEETQFSRMTTSSLGAVISVAILATFSAPFVEEVIYRGLLFSAFRRRFGPVISIALVTSAFAAVHVPQYIESLTTVALLTVISLVLTIIRERTGNLWPCIVFHTVFNAVQSFGIFVLYYSNQMEKAGTDPAFVQFVIIRAIGLCS